MPRSDALFLADMLHAARVSLEFREGRTRLELETNLMFRFALIKAVETIGEAASQVTDEGKIQHPLIRWQAMVSMRNRLVHVYYDIDRDILWDTVNSDIPILVGLLEDTVSST